MTEDVSSESTTQTGVDVATPSDKSDPDIISTSIELEVPSLFSELGISVKGDGNGDGIPDSEQSNVLSFTFLVTPTAVSNPSNAAPVYVTLVADSTNGKTNSDIVSTTVITSIKQLDAPSNKPADMLMPLGLISFVANIPTLNHDASFSIYVDNRIPVNGYWKENTDGSWVNIATPEFGGMTVIEGGKTRLDFNITDGGIFDADGTLNGVIIDPGAIGYLLNDVSVDTDKDSFPDLLEFKNGLTVGIKDNDVFNSDKFYVMQLYRDYLFREAEQEGLAYWLTVFDKKYMSRDEVAEWFIQSPELQSSAGAIVRVYLGLFDQIPDRSSLTDLVNAKLSGNSLSKIANRLIYSDNSESLLFNELSNTSFVEFLYNNILERDPDKVGLNYWDSQLKTGVSREDVLLGFTQSDEYRQSVNDEVSIALNYIGLMGRLPDAEGYKYWLNQMSEGINLPNIIDYFMDTTEYHNRFLP